MGTELASVPIVPNLFFYYDAANFLAASFAGQRLLNTLLLARLLIEGVFLHFLDDVFLLDLALKPTQSIFDGFTILNANLGHSDTPLSHQNRALIISRSPNQS